MSEWLLTGTTIIGQSFVSFACRHATCPPQLVRGQISIDRRSLVFGSIVLHAHKTIGPLTTTVWLRETHGSGQICLNFPSRFAVNLCPSRCSLCNSFQPVAPSWAKKFAIKISRSAGWRAVSQLLATSTCCQCSPSVSIFYCHHPCSFPLLVRLIVTVAAQPDDAKLVKLISSSCPLAGDRSAQIAAAANGYLFTSIPIWVTVLPSCIYLIAEITMFSFFYVNCLATISHCHRHYLCWVLRLAPLLPLSSRLLIDITR